MDFYLYEFLDTQSLLRRPRYAQHSIETFNAAIEGAKAIANKYYANHYSKSDANEPTFDGTVVHLIPETQKAWDAVADFGLMAAHHDDSEGGLQLPEIICKVAGAYIQAANCPSSGYYFVTASAGNLIRAFGSEQHKRLFLHPMMDGRYSGTMALTEPAQGSALADIKTSATPQADGTYRIRGQKNLYYQRRPFPNRKYHSPSVG
jgi:butyryl-CoA dehydrogenase